MPPWVVHAGFVLVGLILTFLVKNLNPPKLEYEVDLITTIDCIESNLSGITYNQDHNTFFVITNSTEKLIEISPTGECIKKFDLQGFEDTEDIYYLSNDEFLIVEERKQALSYIEIKDEKITSSQSLVLNIDDDSNNGLEGVVHCPASNSIYVVNEFPQKIIKISDWDSQQTFDRIETIRSFWAKALMQDYSAITDAGDGLLVLSHESNRLLKLDYEGSIQAGLDLISDYDVGQSEVQPEGVAVDSSNRIYIVSEPNHLHVYKRKPALAQAF